MIGALDELTDHFEKYVEGRSFDDTRKALKANLRAVRKQVLDKEDACVAVAAAIQQAQKRINTWTDVPNKWRAVGDGLEDVYRLASEGFKDGSADPTVEKLHEWRKQAKYLRYQLQVLTPIWPERIKEVSDEADRLTEFLGDDHDLAIMRQMLVAQSEPLGNPSEAEMLLALIDRRRAELEEESMLLGRRFFQDSPKEFTRRLKGYWKTWRSQAARAA
jgi:CHAD domain